MKSSQEHKVFAKLSELERRVEEQSSQLRWMALIIRAAGVNGPWVLPRLAGAVTGRSYDRVMADIDTAEHWRCVKRRQWNMIYGIHYRDDRSPTAKQPTWKINLPEYIEFIKIPPEQLK